MPPVEDKKIRVVFRKASLPLKIAVIAVVLVSMATLLTVWYYKEQTEKEYEQLRQEAISLEQQNSRLQASIDKLGTVQGIIQIAKEELGLVDPDTVIIEPEQ